TCALPIYMLAALLGDPQVMTAHDVLVGGLPDPARIQGFDLLNGHAALAAAGGGKLVVDHRVADKRAVLEHHRDAGEVTVAGRAEVVTVGAFPRETVEFALPHQLDLLAIHAELRVADAVPVCEAVGVRAGHHAAGWRGGRRHVFQR